MYKEVVQRYMMRMRVDFDRVRKLTVCADKSKVGRLPTTLTYIFSLDRNVGAMLPLQVGCVQQTPALWLLQPWQPWLVQPWQPWLSQPKQCPSSIVFVMVFSCL